MLTVTSLNLQIPGFVLTFLGFCWQVIIGSDLLYETEQAPALAAALKHRLAPGGQCLLLCPVRDLVGPLELLYVRNHVISCPIGSYSNCI